MDDEGDFKKARGFLLTYSAVVLALWYFGADLTQFKLMGNEVKLHQRTNSAWLVLATLNIYFWFRCYQRMPRLGLYFDEPMHDLYDKTLVWVALKLRLKRRPLRKLAQEQFIKNFDPLKTMHITSYAADTSVRLELEGLQKRNGDEAPELHQISRSARTKINLSVTYAVHENGQPTQRTGGWRLEHSPNILLTWLVKAFTIARGAFITPWFTDHIAPLALGGMSTALAIWKWCEVNFFTTSPPQAVLHCF